MAAITRRKKLKWSFGHNKFHHISPFGGAWGLACVRPLLQCLTRLPFNADLTRTGPVAAMSYERVDCQLDANVLLSGLAMAMGRQVTTQHDAPYSAWTDQKKGCDTLIVLLTVLYKVLNLKAKFEADNAVGDLAS